MKQNSSGLPESKIRFFQKVLILWFRKNGRKFQWRKEKDPFKILIAEVMLQRTKAEQVVPVYDQFVKEFCDINSIYLSDINGMSKYFGKLGLMWRSKTMVSMAKYIVENHNNAVPATRADLLRIPGIGDYIADAILVFAFNERITVIDSNVIRLVSRFFGLNYSGEIRRNKQFRKFCQTLVAEVEFNELKNFNWSLIDFSSLICRHIPKCHECPLSSGCMYFKGSVNIQE